MELRNARQRLINGISALPKTMESSARLNVHTQLLDGLARYSVMCELITLTTFFRQESLPCRRV